MHGFVVLWVTTFLLSVAHIHCVNVEVGIKLHAHFNVSNFPTIFVDKTNATLSSVTFYPLKIPTAEELTSSFTLNLNEWAAHYTSNHQSVVQDFNARNSSMYGSYLAAAILAKYVNQRFFYVNNCILRGRICSIRNSPGRTHISGSCLVFGAQRACLPAPRAPAQLPCCAPERRRASATPPQIDGRDTMDAVCSFEFWKGKFNFYDYFHGI